METRLSLSILLTSPIITSLSLAFKFHYWSPLVSIFTSLLFLPLALVLIQVSRPTSESCPALNLIVKFMIIGFYAGYEGSAMQDFELSEVSALIILSSFSSIVYALGLTGYSLQKSAQVKFPSIFCFEALKEKFAILDTLTVIVVAEALGFANTIYLGFAYLATRWIYMNFYQVFWWIVVLGVLVGICSKRITEFILNRQKPNVYKY